MSKLKRALCIFREGLLASKTGGWMVHEPRFHCGKKVFKQTKVTKVCVKKGNEAAELQRIGK